VKLANQEVASKLRCPGSKLANLVRLTADETHRRVRTWLPEPNQVRFLNLVREFRAAACVGDHRRRDSATTDRRQAQTWFGV